jgi:hypothetical protein
LIVALGETPPRPPGGPLVHPLTGHHGVYELRFAPDWRATFTFGEGGDFSHFKPLMKRTP